MTALAAPAPSLGVAAFRDWYRSAAVLEAERELLFANSWSVLADEAELATPGQYVTGVIGGVPVVVLRGDDGALVGFENLCRHRGIPVLSGAGSVGRFLTCPYHQWSYRRDGSLVTVPQRESQFCDVDVAGLGLRPVAVESWAGIVFCRPNPVGPSLIESFCGLDKRLEVFTLHHLEQMACVTIEAACNWKLLVENHVDVYHLWYLHQASLNQYEHRRFDWESLGDNWWSLEPLKSFEEAPRTLSFLPDPERAGIGAHLLFPNVMIVTTGDYFATYEATALAPDRTRLTLRVRSVGGTDAEELVAAIRSFLAEDVVACEQLQVATGSPSYGFGPTAASHEEPVRRFHEALRRALTC